MNKISWLAGLFGLLLWSSSLYAQRSVAHPDALQKDQEFLLDSYREALKNQPLAELTLNGSSLFDENSTKQLSMEELAVMARLESQPRYSLGANAGLFLVPPRRVDQAIGTSVNGFAFNNTKFQSSSAFNIGANFQYFIFKKDKLITPFEQDEQGNYPIREYLLSSPFWSVNTGLEYSYEKLSFTQPIDLGFTIYDLQMNEFHQRLVLPVGLRWNLNFIDKSQWNAQIEQVNINKQRIQPLSTFVGLGGQLKILLKSQRTYYTLSGTTKQYINSTGESETPSPYYDKITDDYNTMQLGSYLEYGFRFRSYGQSKTPHYYSIALQYRFPFLFNLSKSELDNNFGAISDQDNDVVFSTGFRDIIYTQSFGEIGIQFSYNLHFHKVVEKK